MIRIENVSKTFDDIKAVDNVSVDINEKIVFGLLNLDVNIDVGRDLAEIRNTELHT